MPNANHSMEHMWNRNARSPQRKELKYPYPEHLPLVRCHTSTKKKLVFLALLGPGMHMPRKASRDRTQRSNGFDQAHPSARAPHSLHAFTGLIITTGL